MWKDGYLIKVRHVILLAKLHDMYFIRQTTHQPLFKVSLEGGSLTQVLLYLKNNYLLAIHKKHDFEEKYCFKAIRKFVADDILKFIYLFLEKYLTFQSCESSASR